jgi:dolichyl-phosphate-mannose-protein mannosyltransferase
MAELRQRIKPTASIQDGPKEKPIDDPKETEEDPKKGRPVPTGYTSIAIILTLLAMFTRLYKLSDSPKVVWDEAHFGKFAGYYIKRTFYFDVHPPLGKMINGFAGLVAGFNGTFEFKSGEPYPKELNFGIMRFFNALFGIGLTPLAYYTGVHLRLSVFASTLLGILTIEEIATMAISRFILLDSMLLFFTALSVYSLALFRNHQLNM